MMIVTIRYAETEEGAPGPVQVIETPRHDVLGHSDRIAMEPTKDGGWRVAVHMRALGDKGNETCLGLLAEAGVSLEEYLEHLSQLVELITVDGDPWFVGAEPADEGELSDFPPVEDSAVNL